MNRQKEKLYRKENKRAMHYHGDTGSDFRYERHTKKMKKFEGTHKSMKGNKQRGMDYTPLFMFLLSKVGEKWDNVFSEAVSRLDKEEPIWWMVKLDLTNKEKYRNVTCGIMRAENAQYHTLTVDENGILVKINPDAKPYPPSCDCHTHTFNGKVIPYIEEPKRTEIYENLLKTQG